jgi:diaminopimelate decarboxylase
VTKVVSRVTQGDRVVIVDTSMPKTLAAATVDRFLPYAQVVVTDDSSPRLAEASAGTGVMSLA